MKFPPKRDLPEFCSSKKLCYCILKFEKRKTEFWEKWFFKRGLMNRNFLHNHQTLMGRKCENSWAWDSVVFHFVSNFFKNNIIKTLHGQVDIFLNFAQKCKTETPIGEYEIWKRTIGWHFCFLVFVQTFDKFCSGLFDMVFLDPCNIWSATHYWVPFFVMMYEKLKYVSGLQSSFCFHKLQSKIPKDFEKIWAELTDLSSVDFASREKILGFPYRCFFTIPIYFLWKNPPNVSHLW